MNMVSPLVLFFARRGMIPAWGGTKGIMGQFYGQFVYRGQESAHLSLC
jgi:hypothetical protein